MSEVNGFALCHTCEDYVTIQDAKETEQDDKRGGVVVGTKIIVSGKCPTCSGKCSALVKRIANGNQQRQRAY